MEKYEILMRIGEGSHGIVLKGKKIDSGEIVAIKKVALKRLQDGIPNQALREIKALQELNHENIIRLREVFAHSAGFCLVFELMVSDLSQLIKDSLRPMTPVLIKTYLQQLLYGLAYMHFNSIMHRDLKPVNLLINHDGLLKIADLGLARLFFKDEGRPYSHQVATRWYRAPELLYGGRHYDEAVDLWAVGCIFGEMLNSAPLFPGDNDIEQLVCVFRCLGTPTESLWPGLNQLPDYSKITFPHYDPLPFSRICPDSDNISRELLATFLRYDPKKRVTAEGALTHRFILSYPPPLTNHQLPKPKPKQIHNSLKLDFDPNSPLSHSLQERLDQVGIN